MSLTEREISTFEVIGEEVRAMIKEAGEKHQAELQECASKIARLENEIEGLISLLGES
ncbi:antitermination protein NusG [Salmonella enterica subsp. enterica serovar Sekondi]|uniref:Antitermination protein NusG n=1 Tax=Salmonella enterica subsp. enterica serovar Ouagadougou TaxID=2564899 RepID=A0A5I0D3E2_SALET|nr:antitermination protein NusG [Salmonella enterica]EAA7110257.1 antitermination protein NusG [Salmonella enterica subsp. enterica serovar Ouagadougou]EBV1890450.1 antitermination protein NusG [Salmonella enterica subsp. enterica serovar Coquilhatville]ECD4598641.1 antitermination protein NusG [Salmonella enterica subsp. enterica serovar Waycross]ECY3516783.1 antitermination protein NusG [Salmonella enterica subsp. enterica serovar Sekondi]MLA11800.1 antitermination protein NusG [Salmonella e